MKRATVTTYPPDHPAHAYFQGLPMIPWQPNGIVAVITERSEWWIKNGWYHRQARADLTRDTDNVTGRLEDHTWFPLRYHPWWTLNPLNPSTEVLPVLRLVPAAGSDARGLVSSPTVRIHGRYDVLPSRAHQPETSNWIPVTDTTGPQPVTHWLRFADVGNPARPHRPRHVAIYVNTEITEVRVVPPDVTDDEYAATYTTELHQQRDDSGG